MMRGYVLTVELKAGAKLYHYPQQVGGHRWALTGAKVVPASLDETCDQLVKEGWLVPGDERNEWVLWQTVSSKLTFTRLRSGCTSASKSISKTFRTGAGITSTVQTLLQQLKQLDLL